MIFDDLQLLGLGATNDRELRAVRDVLSTLNYDLKDDEETCVVSIENKWEQVVTKELILKKTKYGHSIFFIRETIDGEIDDTDIVTFHELYNVFYKFDMIDK
jgi:uncharacterized protein (UPF0248 family)